MAYIFSETRAGFSDYEPLDGCYGTVEACCYKGAYLLLDNGEEAFAYGTANLREGVRVLCTVRAPAQPDRRRLVAVDSVLWDEYDAARCLPAAV